MKQKLLYSGIFLLIVNQLCRVYITKYHYVSADGVLHESLALPLAVLTLMLGGLALLISLGLYSISYFRK